MRKFLALLIILLMTGSLSAKDRFFWVLASGAQAATIFDAQTTVRTLQRCSTCSETNPIMKPFVTTRPVAYSAATAFNTSGVYSSHKMKERGSRWWWAPMVADIGMHTVFGIRNSRIH